MRLTDILTVALLSTASISLITESCLAQEGTLLIQESFEQGVVGECPDGWTCSAPLGDAMVVANTACDGSKSFKLSNEIPQMDRSSIAYRSISLDCLQPFAVELCLTTDNVNNREQSLSLIRSDGFFYFTVLSFGIKQGNFFWSSGFESYDIDSPVPMNNATYTMRIERLSSDSIRLRVDGTVVMEAPWTEPYDFASLMWLTTSSGSVTTTHFDDISLYIGWEEDMSITVEFDSDTLDCHNRGRAVKCYIELPERYPPSMIDVSTMRINDQLAPLPWPVEIGDHDNDGIPDSKVSFWGRLLIPMLTQNELNELTFSFDLEDETHFEGLGEVYCHCERFGAHPGRGIGPLLFNSVTLNSSAMMWYVLDSPGHARLSIHDVAGRLVRTLVDENKPAGRHEVIWQGETDYGTQASAGMYFVRLEVAGDVVTGKALYMK